MMSPIHFLKKTTINISLVLASLLVCWLLLELFFRIISPLPSNHNHTIAENYQDSTKVSGFFQRHSDYGSIAHPNLTNRTRFFHDDTLIFDVQYHTNAQGWRITPHGAQKPIPDIVALGCSFMFGQGVNDDQTLPAYLAAGMSNTAIVNYGLPGSGPHTALRILETHQAQWKNHVNIVILNLLDAHAERVGGHTPYSLYSPKYGWKNGELVFQGQHASVFWYKAINFLIYISKAFDYFTNHHIFPLLSQMKSDRDLLFNILTKMNQIVEKELGAKFIVIYWDLEEDGIVPWAQETKQTLTDLQIPFILTSDILKAPDGFFIPYDYHPTALANQQIAQYLISHDFAGQ